MSYMNSLQCHYDWLAGLFIIFRFPIVENSKNAHVETVGQIFRLKIKQIQHCATTDMPLTTGGKGQWLQYHQVRINRF